jgi:acetyltransferase-like isoleucine patch superfamily enzyme
LRRLPWYFRYDVGAHLMSRVRVLAVKATHLHCRVEFRGPVRMGPGFHLEMLDRGSLVVGRDVEFRRGFVCEIAGNGYVEIGAGTVFTSNALIQCTTSIVIGERCGFGQSALIFDGVHRYADVDKHWGDQGWDYEPIVIGDGVGVSDKCTIQSSIGERAMIASGSVVNRPIPAYSVAAGIPARVVRYFGPERPTDGVATTTRVEPKVE